MSSEARLKEDLGNLEGKSVLKLRNTLQVLLTGEQSLNTMGMSELRPELEGTEQTSAFARDDDDEAPVDSCLPGMSAFPANPEDIESGVEDAAAAARAAAKVGTTDDVDAMFSVVISYTRRRGTEETQRVSVSPYATVLEGFPSFVEAFGIEADEAELLGVYIRMDAGIVKELPMGDVFLQHGVTDGTVLELRLRSSTSKVAIKVCVADPFVVQVQYDALTKVSDILELLVTQLTARGHHVAGMELFLPAEVLFLSPYDTLASYQLGADEYLELKVRPPKASTKSKSVAVKINFEATSSDSSAAVLAAEGETVTMTARLKLELTMTVAEALRLVNKKFLVKHVREYGLVLYADPKRKLNGDFLPPGALLDTYANSLSKVKELYFQRRLRPYKVTYPNGKIVRYRLEDTTTVGQLTAMLAKSGGRPPSATSLLPFRMESIDDTELSLPEPAGASAQTSARYVRPPPPANPPPPPPMPPANWEGKRRDPHKFSPELFGLYLPLPYFEKGQPVLDASLQIGTGSFGDDVAKCGGHFFYKRIKQPIKVYFDDPSLGRLDEDFMVDYSQKVVRVIPIICRKFGLRHPYHYELTKGDASGALVRIPYEESLLQAEVPYGSWAMLHKLPDSQIPPPPDAENGNTNVWDSPPPGPENMVPVEGTPPGADLDSAEIEMATLNKIVERLTHPTAHSLRFQQIVLMTYESFTTSEMLVTKLLERYYVPRQAGESMRDYDKRRSTVTLRIINVMRNWFPKSYEDFSPSLKEFVSSFIHNTLVEDGWGKLASSLYAKTIQKVEAAAASKDEELAMAAIAASAAAASSSSSKKSKKRSLWDYDDAEVAQQMSIIDYDLYKVIKPREYISQGWEREKYHHLCPRLMAFIDHFNDISNWVILSIVSQDTLKKRIKRMEAIVRIGKELAELNNFNSLMAIVCGLNTAAMLRLKFTRGGLSKKTAKLLEELEAICSAEGSYKTLRARIASASPPCIPYVGVYMQDLTFISDGNEDTVNGLINLGKRGQVYNVIDRVQLFMQEEYPYEKIPLLNRTLAHPTPGISEDDLYQLSLAREPRGCSKGDLK